MSEHWIPAENIEKLTADIAKLNAKASKLGCEPVRLEVTAEEKFVKLTEAATSRKLVKVLVEGRAPKLNGWRFLARLEHLDEGNLAYVAPEETLPEEFRDAPLKCDHCGLSRKRNDTYIVAHDDGRVRQVGSSCLADFLGHASPEGIANLAELMTSGLTGILEDAEDAERGASNGRTYINLEELLAMTSAVVAKNGWTSVTEAREKMVSATRDQVCANMWPPPGAGDVIRPAPQDYEAAKAAIEWAKAVVPPAGNDYMGNVKVIASAGHTTSRGIGIAVSIIAAYKRHLSIELEKRRWVDSKHIGAVGKRGDFNLTCDLVRPVGSMYPSYLTKFHDAEMNVYVWFASKPLDEGKEYRLRATVKEHSEYKGIKQTVLTRGVVQ